MSFNSSGKPQLLNALTHYKEGAQFSGDKVKVAAIMGQEQYARGGCFADLQHQAKRAKWHLHGCHAAAADRAEGSAGTCISARMPVQIGKLAHWDVDVSPAVSPGRLSAVWSDGVLRGGLLMISVYFWHGEGLTDRNMEILSKAADIVLSHGGPWAIGGDFNMEAKELSGASELLRRMRGVVVVPSGTTCKTKPGGSVIDFFLLDRRLQGSIEGCFADATMASSPHDAVVLVLRTDAAKTWTRTLVSQELSSDQADWLWEGSC